PLAHAAAVRGDERPAPLAEADLLQERPADGGRARARVAVQPGVVADVLVARLTLRVPRALRQDADPPPDLLWPRVRDARDREPAVARRQDRRQHANRRRLAGAVRAEHAEHLAGVDADREVGEGEQLAVALPDALRDHDRAHAGDPTSRR